MVMKLTVWKRVCLCGIACIRICLSWNYIGHEAVASIAESLVSAETKESLKQIFLKSSTDTNGNLSTVAVWPDSISSLVPTLWTKNFHFVLVEGHPPHKCPEYVQARDCPENNCIVAAIANYTMRLKDPEISDDERMIALKFLNHIVGDSHCPPHVTSREYLGLHSFGTWEGKLAAVHKIWDSQLIKKRSTEFGGKEEYIKMLINHVTTKTYRRPSNPKVPDIYANTPLTYCIGKWITHTSQYTCKSAYKTYYLGVEFSGKDYYDQIKEDIDTLLIFGGIRLARLFEYTFSKGSKYDLCASDGLSVEHLIG